MATTVSARPWTYSLVTLGTLLLLTGAACVESGAPPDQTAEPMGADQTTTTSSGAPRFRVDPFWPTELPNNWILGQVSGVAVDAHDHVWIVHRGNLGDNEMPAALDPPQADDCCFAAPPILEFDVEGNLVGHWGGPGDGYDWPTSNHGIVVDHAGPEHHALGLGITRSHALRIPPGLVVGRGGPVDTARGFLIHSQDFKQPDTIEVQDNIFVTGTIDALTSLTEATAPQKALFALGYAGRQAGQLEREVRQNAWLTLPATPELVFSDNYEAVWNRALSAIGVTPAQLSALSGNA